MSEYNVVCKAQSHFKKPILRLVNLLSEKTNCKTPYLIVYVTEKHYVQRFFTCFIVLMNSMLFRYIGRLVTSQQKCTPFSLFYIILTYFRQFEKELRRFRGKVKCSFTFYFRFKKIKAQFLYTNELWHVQSYQNLP